MAGKSPSPRLPGARDRRMSDRVTGSRVGPDSRASCRDRASPAASTQASFPTAGPSCYTLGSHTRISAVEMTEPRLASRGESDRNLAKLGYRFGTTFSGFSRHLKFLEAKNENCIFGNCQLAAVSHYISIVCENCESIHASDNVRNGDFLGAGEIYKHLQSSDIIACQHLDETHGLLSTHQLRSNFPQKPIITAPYIFISGITIIGYAPMSPKFSYGEIYGHEEIAKILDRTESAAAVIAEIENGNDLGSVGRFHDCIDQLIVKEKSLDVTISGLMRESYQAEFLMITHNHPTNFMFVNIIEQILKIIGTPHDDRRLQSLVKIDNQLTYTGAPYIPQDIHRLGIKFGFHTDWKEKISHLVDMMIRSRHGDDVAPSIFGGIRLPDAVSV